MMELHRNQVIDVTRLDQIIELYANHVSKVATYSPMWKFFSHRTKHDEVYHSLVVYARERPTDSTEIWKKLIYSYSCLKNHKTLLATQILADFNHVFLARRYWIETMNLDASVFKSPATVSQEMLIILMRRQLTAESVPLSVPCPLCRKAATRSDFISLPSREEYARIFPKLSYPMNHEECAISFQPLEAPLMLNGCGHVFSTDSVNGLFTPRGVGPSPADTLFNPLEGLVSPHPG